MVTTKRPSIPPAFRQSRLPYLAPTEHNAVLSTPFSVPGYLWAHVRLFVAHPRQSASGWFKTWFDRIYDAKSVSSRSG